MNGSWGKTPGEGNCGEVTNRGEEACECAVKLTHKRRRQPHSRQSCEVTDRNSIQGRYGQASEPTITKPPRKTLTQCSSALVNRERVQRKPYVLSREIRRTYLHDRLVGRQSLHRLTVSV